VDELIASGALEDVTGGSKDDITLELERLASTNDVELELAKMKQQIGAGPSATAPAIEAAEAVEVVDVEAVDAPPAAPAPEASKGEGSTQ
jgi:phage shock protein A